MAQNHLAALTRALHRVPSRRDVFRAMAGAGFGLGVTQLPGQAVAKKKHKHKKSARKAKPNAFGCLEAGDPCKTADKCCSGICKGKKGKRRCQAHGAGTCNQAADGFCEAENPDLTACNGTFHCTCQLTTAGSKFCADFTRDTASECADCRNDTDCKALGFPAGSACAPVSASNCMGVCEGGMMCVAPCTFEPPLS